MGIVIKILIESINEIPDIDADVFSKSVATVKGFQRKKNPNLISLILLYIFSRIASVIQ